MYVRLGEGADIFVASANNLRLAFLSYKAGIVDPKESSRSKACSRFCKDISKTETFFDKSLFYDCCLENLVHGNIVSADNLNSAILKSVPFQITGQKESFSDDVEKEFERYQKSLETSKNSVPNVSTGPLYLRAKSRNKALLRFLSSHNNSKVMSEKESDALEETLARADEVYSSLSAMGYIANELRNSEYNSKAKTIGEFLGKMIETLKKNTALLSKEAYQKKGKK